jgi:hypothetical protein
MWFADGVARRAARICMIKKTVDNDSKTAVLEEIAKRARAARFE